jgi:hypothetical protein
MPTAEIQRLVDNHGSRLKEPAHLEAEARSFNVSRDALFYRLTKAGVFRWTEKSLYFPGGFQIPTPPEQRVEQIEPQVDPAFLHVALSLFQSDTVTAGKLAQWFFAQRHIIEEYLAKLAEDVDMAISDENNHEDEPHLAA